MKEDETAGERVWVHPDFPNGLTHEEYMDLFGEEYTSTDEEFEQPTDDSIGGS